MRNLTDKQQLFLDVLFEEAKGDAAQARKLAGYAETVSTSSVVNSLQDEISERTKKFISTTATKAAFSMKQIMDSPTDLGNKERLEYKSKLITDRIKSGKAPFSKSAAQKFKDRYKVKK